MKVDFSDLSNIIPILGFEKRNSSRLKRFGTWLITPSVKILQPDILRQSRLLAAMLMALVTLGVLAEALSLALGSYVGVFEHILTTLTVVCLSIAYLLNRAGHITLAAWITVALQSIAIYGLTFFTGGLPIDVDFLIYLVLPFIFASVFFSARMIGILAAIFIGGILLAAFIPGVSFVNLLLGPVSFIAMACGILFVIFRQRNIMELDRRRELVEKEERYRTLLETSYEGICIISGGKILDANPNFARMLGYELTELVGEPLGGRLPIEMYTEDPATPIGHEGHLSMMSIIRKDGTSFYIEAVSRMQTYRGEPAQVIAIRNITERVQAEAALDHNERLYRSLFEGANDAIFLVGFDDTYINANQKAGDMLGYSVNELIGKPVSEVVAEREYPHTLAKKNDLLTGEVISLYERVFRKKDGSEFPAEVNISLVRDRDDHPLFIQSIVRDITERKLTEARILLQLERLNALREIDKMITGSLDLHATLTILLGWAQTQLGTSAADILLINPPSATLEVFAELGFGAESTPRAAVDLYEPLAGRAASEGRLISILDLSTAMQGCPRIGSLISQGFEAGFAVPLIAKGEVKGVLEVFQRQGFQPSIEWVDFLETLGGQAAIAVDSYKLFQSLQRSNMDLVQAYDATLEGWAKALELRDEETEGHSHRVVDMTVRLGRENGYSEGNLVHLRRGALLHDIGKLSIPDSILLKPGALTVEEWQIMKLHPVYAKQMLSDILFLNLASDIPYFHHEKWDGSGYPHGLQGEEIPLAARLFAIVDVWDALTSDRPYRRAWTKEKALDYIRQQKGKHFDPKVVEQFFDLVEKP